MLGPIAPHVVIEGRPKLTQWIWDQCPVKPIILSSQPLRSKIYQRDVAMDRGSDVYCFFGIMCIPEVRELFKEFDFLTQLRSIFDIARKRFGLHSSDPLNVVAAGGHGSLWMHEHASVGRLANPFEFEAMRGVPGSGPLAGLVSPPVVEDESHEETRSKRALELLLRSAENRAFAGEIARTLGSIEHVELRWLRECFPGIGAFDVTADRDLQEAARYCRTFMGEPYGAGLGGALPQIYVRQGGRYRLFTRYDAHDAIDELRSPTNPFRTTTLLLQQFAELRRGDPNDERLALPAHDGNPAEQRVATFDPESWTDACLTKLIPRQLVRGNLNPLDNPVLGENQYAAARMQGLSYVLLDDDRGVLDFPDTFRHIEILDDRPEFTLQVARPLVKALQGLAALTLGESAKIAHVENVAAKDPEHEAAKLEALRGVLSGLHKLIRSLLETKLLAPFKLTRDELIRDAYLELILDLEGIDRGLYALQGLDTPPPPLSLDRIRRDCRAIAFSSQALVAHVANQFPEIERELRDTLSKTSITAWLDPPRIYKI